MNWKIKALIGIMALVTAAFFIKMPFQTDSTAQSLTDAEMIVSVEGTVTTYRNGIKKTDPSNFAVSGALKDMPTAARDGMTETSILPNEEEIEEMRIEKLKKRGFTQEQIEKEEINFLNTKEVKKIVPGLGDIKDVLVSKGARRTDAPQAMPTPSLTFDGATAADNIALGIGGLTPPDTNGDIGPNHYVSSVNKSLKIFNKNGTVAAGPVATSSLFAALPANDACRIQNDGDAVVLYDTLADRWHISQFGLPDGNVTYQCIALSVTGDPTGAYYVWSYAYPISAINDYPKVGVWTDGYHMTFNQFNISPSSFIGVGILTQDRLRALVGDPNASVVYVNFATIDRTAFALLPGDIDGFVGPPTGAAETFAEVRANEFGDPIDAIRMYKWVPDFTTPSNSVLTTISDIPLAAFDGRSPSGHESRY